MNLLSRLQAWYAAQCDGDWEHLHGVHIETLDNPGWLVKIDVTGTPLDGRPFVEVAEGVGTDAHPDSAQWIHCSVQCGVWNGASDETQLAPLLRLFLDWAEGDAEPDGV